MVAQVEELVELYKPIFHSFGAESVLDGEGVNRLLELDKVMRKTYAGGKRDTDTLTDIAHDMITYAYELAFVDPYVHLTAPVKELGQYITTGVDYYRQYELIYPLTVKQGDVEEFESIVTEQISRGLEITGDFPPFIKVEYNGIHYLFDYSDEKESIFNQQLIDGYNRKIEILDVNNLPFQIFGLYFGKVVDDQWRFRGVDVRDRFSDEEEIVFTLGTGTMPMGDAKRILQHLTVPNLTGEIQNEK